MAQNHIILAGDCGSFCLSKWMPPIGNYNQPQSCVLVAHFPQSNHFDLATSVVGLLPSWPQPSDLHWGWTSLFSTRESIYFRLRQGLAQSPTYEHDDRPSLQANNTVGNAESLTTHRGKNPSTWHTWAKGFLLIKSHLAEMTSTRLLCLSICSSLPDLFCVWKLNS